MDLLPRIFLGDLQFQHLIRARQTAEQRGYRLPHLEIHRPVLNLQDDALMKTAVQRPEVIIGRLARSVERSRQSCMQL